MYFSMLATKHLIIKKLRILLITGYTYNQIGQF